MPGIQLVVDDRGLSARPAPHRSGPSRGPTHTSTVFIDSENAYLAATHYPGYRVRSWEDPRYTYFLEGERYDLAEDELVADSRRIAEALFRDDRSLVRDWIASADGDFVLVIRDRQTDAWRVVCDAFARLAVFIHRDDHRVIASRDLEFVVRERGDARVDPLELGHYLLLGYGQRSTTVFAGIESLPPGGVLAIDPREGTSSLTENWTFDFDDKSDRSPEAHAEKLAALFETSCARRSTVRGHNVLSLSGGLDSRAVAGGLHRAGATFSSITMDRPGWYSPKETELARDVCRALDRPWDTYMVPNPTGRDYRELLELKHGQNDLGLAFILSFFREIRRRFGDDVAYFTGDGGDFAVVDLRAPDYAQDPEQLAYYLIQRRSLFSIVDAAVLSGVETSELFDYVVNYFESLPERTAAGKFEHYYIRLRAIHWIFQGEDRNREYFWSTTPFFEPKFLRAAMRCPAAQKEHSHLYRLFLDRLAPELANLGVAYYMGPLGSRRYRLSASFKNALKSRRATLRPLKQFLAAKTHARRTPPVARVLAQQLDRCDAVREQLNAPALERVIANAPQYTRLQLMGLVTVTSAIEHLQGVSTFDQLLDEAIP